MYRLIVLSFILEINCQFNSLDNTHLLSFGIFSPFYQLKPKPKNKSCCWEDPTKLLLRDLEPGNHIVRKLCTPDFDLREDFSYFGYEIKYKFKEDIRDSSKVGVDYRAISLILTMESGKEIQHYRILPEGMRVNDAVWKIGGDEVIINIPYEHRDIEIPMSCPRDNPNPMDIETPLSPEYRLYWLDRYGVNIDKQQNNKFN